TRVKDRDHAALRKGVGGSDPPLSPRRDSAAAEPISCHWLEPLDILPNAIFLPSMILSLIAPNHVPNLRLSIDPPLPATANKASRKASLTNLLPSGTGVSVCFVAISITSKAVIGRMPITTSHLWTTLLSRSSSGSCARVCSIVSQGSALVIQ